MEHKIKFDHTQHELSSAMGISPERERELAAILHHIEASRHKSIIDCESCEDASDCLLKEAIPKVKKPEIPLTRPTEAIAYMLEEAKNPEEVVWLSFYLGHSMHKPPSLEDILGELAPKRSGMIIMGGHGRG